MSKRTVRRPTEEAALAHVMREQKRQANHAVMDILRDKRSGKHVEPELLEMARQVFGRKED